MKNPAHDTVPFPKATQPQPLGGGLGLVSAAQFEAVPATPSRVITTRNWLCEMVIDGALEVSVERGAWYRRDAGTGVLYRPGASYRERGWEGGSRRGYTSLYVFFSGPADPLPALLGLTGPFAWVADADGRLAPLLHDIITGVAGGAAAAVAAVGSLYHLVGLLIAAEVRRDTLIVAPAGAALPDMIATVHRYMRENLARPIRLAHLANCAGLSESALSHAYRRITGRTPMTALRGFRVEAAKGHLVRGRLTLEAIAELIGFADAFHLSRTFKAITGESPRQFRG